MKQNVRSLSVIILLTIVSRVMVNAQGDIQTHYQEFYDKASTWEDYKLIKKPGLNNFWQVVTDTLDEKNSKIEEYAVEVSVLNSQLDEVSSMLEQREQQLAKSESLNDSIAFLGIQVGKTVYNIIVWCIIFGLIGGVISFYLMYERSNVITRKTRKEFGELEKENEEVRRKARDTQIKLKRELQTALNALEKV